MAPAAVANPPTLPPRPQSTSLPTNPSIMHPSERNSHSIPMSSSWLYAVGAPNAGIGNVGHHKMHIDLSSAPVPTTNPSTTSFPAAASSKPNFSNVRPTGNASEHQSTYLHANPSHVQPSVQIPHSIPKPPSAAQHAVNVSSAGICRVENLQLNIKVSLAPVPMTTTSTTSLHTTAPSKQRISSNTQPVGTRS